MHLAAAHGLQDAMKERLMRAYLTEGEPIGDPAALERLAVEVGLPDDEVRDLLAGDRFADEVREDERTAAWLRHPRGAVLRRRPRARRVRRAAARGPRRAPAARLGGASRPIVQVVADGEACGPDGC